VTINRKPNGNFSSTYASDYNLYRRPGRDLTYFSNLTLQPFSKEEVVYGDRGR
jgi:hypothetical protein